MISILEQIIGGATNAATWVASNIEQKQGAWVFLLSTALVGGFGAYFGARGAQQAINREDRLRRRTETIIAANAAHSLTATILNQAVSLKKQFYLPRLQGWEQQRESAIDKRKAGKTDIAVELHLGSAPPIYFPITNLADLVYSKLSLNGRPLAALAELFQAEHSLDELAEHQDDLRDSLEEMPRRELPVRYLALDAEWGRDDRFRDIFHGSVDLLDDLIFFSQVMGKDLLEHAKRVRDRSNRRERKRLPEVNSPSKIDPEYEYLIPQHDHHSRWLKHHILIVREPKAWTWKKLNPFSGALSEGRNKRGFD